jgi:hypothetical protein
VRTRVATVTASACLLLIAVLEVQVSRRYRAFGLFLRSPADHPNPYNVGRTFGSLGLLVLLIGCAVVTVEAFRRAKGAGRAQRVASVLALVAVAATTLFVQPFSSRAFVEDRRHDAGVGIGLLAVAALTLGAVVLVNLRRRQPLPADGLKVRTD